MNLFAFNLLVIMLLPALILFEGGGKDCLQKSSGKQFVSVRSADTFFIYLFNKLRAYACEALLRMPISHALLRGETKEFFNKYLITKNLIMRKFTIKSLLITAALCLGTNAWAEETTVLYERGTTTAWSEDDLAEEAWNVSISDRSFPCTPVINETLGLSLPGKVRNQEIMNSTQIVPTANSILTIDAVWNVGGTTGKNGNKTYFKIGNQIEFFAMPQDQKGGVIVNGTTYNFSNACNRDNNNRSDDVWTINVVINTATNVITALNVSGQNGNTKVSEALADLSLGIDAIFNTLSLGCVRMANSMYTSLKSIKISECKQTLNEANYTIKYLCGDIVVKDQAIRSGVVNKNILLPQSDKEVIWKDNVKYIYVSDDSSDKTITEDGLTVVTVTYRKADTYSYTINATDGANVITDIKSGSNFEGETISYAYSLYVNKEGTLYKKGPVNSQYNGSFKLTENNQVVNLAYAATDITNVEYWSEAEDIEGMTIITEGNTTIRSSASASAYAEQDVVFTTLPAGKYKITVNICDAAGKNPSGTVFNFKAGESVFFGYAAGNINNSSGSGEFNLVKDTQISIAKAGKNKIGIDYIYIQRIGDATTTQNVTVGSNGIATFTPSVALDFTNATNIKAYTATVSETTVTLTETKTVAAGEGVIIKSVNGGEAQETIAVANPATATKGNALVGTLVDIAELATTDGTYNNYILNVVGGKVGFYQANNKKVAAGKAYLQVPVTNGAKALTIVWNDGETTGIEENYEFGTMNSDAATFDLSGRKVANPAKGLYIKNGKKFIVR